MAATRPIAEAIKMPTKSGTTQSETVIGARTRVPTMAV